MSGGTTLIKFLCAATLVLTLVKFTAYDSFKMWKFFLFYFKIKRKNLSNTTNWLVLLLTLITHFIFQWLTAYESFKIWIFFYFIPEQKVQVIQKIDKSYCLVSVTHFIFQRRPLPSTTTTYLSLQMFCNVIYELALQWGFLPLCPDFYLFVHKYPAALAGDRRPGQDEAVCRTFASTYPKTNIQYLVGMQIPVSLASCVYLPWYEPPGPRVGLLKKKKYMNFLTFLCPVEETYQNVRLVNCFCVHSSGSVSVW